MKRLLCRIFGHRPVIVTESENFLLETCGRCRERVLFSKLIKAVGGKGAPETPEFKNLNDTLILQRAEAIRKTMRADWEKRFRYPDKTHRRTL